MSQAETERGTMGQQKCWRRPADCWWPRTCRSRPSATWRSRATTFAGCRPSGTT